MVSKMLIGRDQIDLRLDYKGLNLDGPSKCSPLVVCVGDRVDRWSLIEITEKELLKLISQKKSISGLADALRSAK